MKVKNLVKFSLGIITTGFLLSGCTGSQPLAISNLVQSNKNIEISKNLLPIKEQGGVMFNDELITDKLGNIYTFGTVGDELYYGITDTKNDKVLIKNSKGKIIKEFPNLDTPTVSYGINISQNDNKTLYIYERFGNIYKTIQKFDGKEFTTLIKNKDIYLNEYKIGKFIFVVPTNVFGPTKTSYQNIEIDKQKDITNRIKRVEADYKERVFPILATGNNIVYTYDYSIFVLNTLTNEVKTVATTDSKIQFLKNGYDYYLRVLNNPKDINMYSKTNDFNIPSKYINLQTLEYENITLPQLEKMKVAKIKDFQIKDLIMSVYEVRDVENYFLNQNGLYVDNNKRKSGPGFLYYFK